MHFIPALRRVRRVRLNVLEIETFVHRLEHPIAPAFEPEGYFNAPRIGHEPGKVLVEVEGVDYAPPHDS